MADGVTDFPGIPNITTPDEAVEYIGDPCLRAGGNVIDCGKAYRACNRTRYKPPGRSRLTFGALRKR